MKKSMKILSSVLMIVVLFSMTVVFAVEWGGIKPDQTNVPAGAANTAGTILGFVQFIGYAIAIGMLIYVGIKYVMASADEKASLKNAMIRYVIGAALIAGATSIAGWIFNLGRNV